MAEIDQPENSSPDRPADMSANELAAFQKIMDEIEGQEKDSVDEPDSETPDDFSADSEQSVQEADTDDSADSTETADREGSQDGLDEDQQQALESIMAQVEGGKTAETDADSDKATQGTTDPEAKADSSAELEPVVQQAGTADTAESTDPPDDNPLEAGLDEDQQQALESIMAQIEGGKTAGTDADSGKATQGTTDPEAKADFSAESSSAVNETGAAKGDDSQDADIEAADGVLDQDQQHAVDIDDILKSITVSDNETPTSQAAGDEAAGEPAVIDSPEAVMLDDDIIVSKKDDCDLKQPGISEPSPSAAANEPSIESEKTPPEQSLLADKAAKAAPAPARSPTAQPTSPLAQAGNSTTGAKKRVILASVAAMVLLGIVGCLLGLHKGIIDSKAPLRPVQPPRTDEMVQTQAIPATPLAEATVHDASDLSRLKTVADSLDHLRNELIEKQAEIEELRAYYQAGIDAEIQAILDTGRQTSHGKISFKAAMADPQISLGLSAIQRRHLYIKKLQSPVDKLSRNSEALLFFSRKAGLLALMAAKTSDIDIDGFIGQAESIRAKYSSALAHLNIDAVEASGPALKAIWQDIAERLPTTPVNPIDNPNGPQTANAAIWKDICNGEYRGKHKLTALSADAARCLARWNGKDLFLNALTDLSVEAARELAAWEGDWLGLNGLRQLSPEAAMHLSRWKGKKLSLNGLSRLAPRVAAILSEWQGDQIELVNVKHLAHWENAGTRLFLSEDLNRRRNATRK